MALPGRVTGLARTPSSRAAPVRPGTRQDKQVEAVGRAGSMRAVVAGRGPRPARAKIRNRRGDACRRRSSRGSPSGTSGRNRGRRRRPQSPPRARRTRSPGGARRMRVTRWPSRVRVSRRTPGGPRLPRRATRVPGRRMRSPALRAPSGMPPPGSPSRTPGRRPPSRVRSRAPRQAPRRRARSRAPLLRLPSRAPGWRRRRQVRCRAGLRGR